MRASTLNAHGPQGVFQHAPSGEAPGVKIKAAGGICTAAQARAMLEAGADRIGTSNSVAMLWEAGTATHT